MANWFDEHNKRWDIEYNAAQQFEQFKFRLITITSENSGLIFSEAQIRVFNFYMGGTIIPEYQWNISEILKKAGSVGRLATMLRFIFKVFENREQATAVDDLHDNVELCLRFTPQVGMAIARTESGVILYPSGAELLDNKVVNQTLGWLVDHPKVLEPFETALQLYMDGDPNKQRNLLDNLRYSIEQLLKEVLNNSKSLENQQKELALWLKGKAVHQQVINLYTQLLFGPFRQYQNDAVKHAGEYQAQDVEFMIYLAGTFMRLLLQLEKQVYKPPAGS